MNHPAVVFGGPSPEHDISILTGLQAARTLAEEAEAHALYWTKAGAWFLVDASLEAADFAEGVPPKARPLTLVAAPGGGYFDKRHRLDIAAVVNCCHGGPGEDGTLQAAFDLAGLRATGPGVAGAALCMDKYSFGAAVAAGGLPTLPRVLLDSETPPDFEAPFIVKPRFGGSSLGIEVVEDLATAVALRSTSPLLADGAVVEPFLADVRDLEIAVRTYPGLQLSAIRAPERSSGGSIYSYGEKYLAWGGQANPGGGSPVDPGLARRAREAARVVVALAGLRSVARIDFLCRGDQLWVNEVNTIPGSLAHYLWVDPPVSRRDLLGGMVEEALAASPRRFRVTGADGTALRNAASIAQKLG
ncbi:MAG: hypothetical protein ACRDVM_05770 [Acidimicrobiia bacterium]